MAGWAARCCENYGGVACWYVLRKTHLNYIGVAIAIKQLIVRENSVCCVYGTIQMFLLVPLCLPGVVGSFV